MTIPHAFAALALALALACAKQPPTVDASGSPTPALTTTSGPCYTVRPDSAGNRWLYPTPCATEPPSQPPPDSTPVTGICCTPPNGPCLAVEKASECDPANNYIDCGAGYETLDGNGQPTVLCFDAAGG
jgi:hypothetical protein